MNKILILFVISTLFLFTAKIKYSKWRNNLTLIGYLEKKEIPTGIIADLDQDDIKLLSEIISGNKFYELIASNGVLLQTLIPISEELYIHIFKTFKDYKIDILPIEYQTKTYIANISIEESSYSDIVKKIKNKKLAAEFSRVFKHRLNLRKIHKGDKVIIIYEQKMRLGQPIYSSIIKFATVITKNKSYYIFRHKDNKYYDKNGKVLVSKYMHQPLSKIKITSPFTNRRFHPILKKWKAHLGVDFRGKIGTPIKSIADGKVIFSGWKSGYGKVTKIKHSDNYISLYAHQSRFKVKKGQRVKQGQIIGYVGNTGRSTGPHLHLGLYRNNIAINPNRKIKFSKRGIPSRDKKVFIEKRNRYISIAENIKNKNRESYIWNSINKYSVSPKDKEYYKSRGW